MPRGLMRSCERDVRNFTFEEWQQAKRSDKDPNAVRQALRECWAVSDSRAAFAQALETRGFKLARGDRRGYVAVDMHGNPFAVAKYTGIRTKDVRARLGLEDDKLPSVEQCREDFARTIHKRLSELHGEEERRKDEERKRREAERRALVERQRIERAQQVEILKVREQRETAERQARFNRGLRGLLDRITGKHARIREQNLRETQAAIQRDGAERDATAFRQLAARRQMDEQRREALRRSEERQRELRDDMKAHEPAPPERTIVQPEREPKALTPARAPPERLTPAFTMRASAEAARDDREEFIRQRKDEAAQRNRTRGPRRDLDR